jgi:AcrR family transcriptional regulator
MSPRRAKALHGRVGDDPAAALRAHLIDAAERLMAHVPFSAIKTRDIAREAEVSDGVLYNYFQDKNDLILAALLARYSSLAAQVEAGIPTPGEGAIEDNLTAFATSLMRLTGEIVPTFAGLVSEPALLHRLAEGIHGRDDSPAHLQRRLVEYVAAEQRLGRISGDVDSTAAVALIMGACVVLNLTAHFGPAVDPGVEEEQLRRIVTTLMRGLSSPAR